MQVERSISIDSGRRVRNTLVTYPALEDNSPKGVLILRIILCRKVQDESYGDAGGAYVLSACW